MLPSIDLRIENIVKALEQVVLPALTRRERLAKDQVNLCIGHLRMIGQQWRHAAAFEARSFDAMVGLAETLLLAVDESYAAELSDALAAAKTVDRLDLGAVEHGIVALGGLIDRIILGEDGKLPLSAAARDAILDYGDRQALRERAWFAMTGLDPERKSLPSIEEIMAS